MLADWLTIINEDEIKTEDDVSNIITKIQNRTNKILLGASDSGNLPQAQDAVANGALVNCLDSFGRTPVMLAIKYNHYSVAEWLLTLQAVNVNCGEMDGETTLTLATRKCTSDKIVTTVASLSEDVNKLNKEGRTPAQVAVDRSNVGGVLGLLAIPGVEWQVKEKNGDSLLEMAR